MRGFGLDRSAGQAASQEISRWLLDLNAGRAPEHPPNVSDRDFELAIRHGLIGVMATETDPRTRALARPVFARLNARQGVMQSNTKRTLESLHRNGIRATVQKGPALAMDSYQDPSQRTFTDIDLLVPSEQLSQAIGVLSDDLAVSNIPPKTPKADKRNVPFADPSGVDFNLDLHWDLFSYSQLGGCANGATEWAWEHALLDAEHQLGPMWRLPQEAIIAFLCSHAVLDHRFRLILFRDLAEVARRDPDWDAVVRFAIRWQLRSTTYVGLFLATLFAAAPIDPDVLADLRPASMPIRAVERLLPRTDVVHFDGHSVHPLNLAMVLLHDNPKERRRLLAAAPLAFPGWRRRVGLGPVLPLARRNNIASERDSRVGLTLHVLPIDIARGAQTYAEALSRLLDDESSPHRTMTIFDSEPVALHADIEIGAPRGRARQFGFDPRAAWRLWREVRRLEPTLIVAHGGESLKYAALTSPRAVRLVYYKIGTSRVSLSNPLRRLVYRLLIRRADAVAGASREMVSEARSDFGVPEERTSYVPNGRDPAPFRDWQGSPDGSVRFVFVGHVTRTKRPERFVRMIRALVDSGLDVDGVLVGDGAMSDQVREMSQGLPISVLGRRDDVPDLLATADVFVFTSLEEGEGMPGVLIEASMAGLPVVTTDVPGAGTVIDDGVTGLVVPVDDFDALAGAAARLAADPELRRSMGIAGRERALSQFTLDASIAQWRLLLNNVDNGQPPPAAE